MNRLLDVGRPAHLTGDAAYAQADERREGEEVDDACAVTIASWWAGSRYGNGLAMAELATSGRVDLDRLLDDIAAARRDASDPVYADRDRRALDVLRTWALAKGRAQAAADAARGLTQDGPAL